MEHIEVNIELHKEVSEIDGNTNRRPLKFLEQNSGLIMAKKG